MYPSEQINREKYYIAKHILERGGKLCEAKEAASDPAAGEVVHRIEILLQKTFDSFNKKNQLTGSDRIQPLRECIEFNSRVRDEHVPHGFIKYSTLLKHRQLLTMCIYASDKELWRGKITAWNKRNRRVSDPRLKIDERYCCEDLRNFVEFFKDIIHQQDVDERRASTFTVEEQDRMLNKAKAISPELSYALRRLFLFKNEDEFIRTFDSLISNPPI